MLLKSGERHFRAHGIRTFHGFMDNECRNGMALKDTIQNAVQHFKKTLISKCNKEPKMFSTDWTSINWINVDTQNMPEYKIPHAHPKWKDKRINLFN